MLMFRDSFAPAWMARCVLRRSGASFCTHSLCCRVIGEYVKDHEPEDRERAYVVGLPETSFRGGRTDLAALVAFDLAWHASQALEGSFIGCVGGFEASST